MNRFCYSAGDMEVGETQCALCKFRLEEDQTRCEKYEEIPEEVLKSEKKCIYFRNEKFVDL